MNEVRNSGDKNPLFLRFINKETGIQDLLLKWSSSKDEKLSKAANGALNYPPNVDDFRQEIEEAVRDLIDGGLGEEFKAFVNHYLDALEEDLEVREGKYGQNTSQVARIKDEKGPWIQGIICYNLCLYIKAFGLENLKSCKVCSKLFAHKGKWATYCSEPCKKKAQTQKTPKRGSGPLSRSA